MSDADRIRLDTRADAIRALRTDIAEIDAHIALLQKRGCGQGVMNGTVKLRNSWVEQVEYMEVKQEFDEAMYALDQRCQSTTPACFGLRVTGSRFCEAHTAIGEK